MIPAESKPDANSSATVTSGREMGEKPERKWKRKIRENGNFMADGVFLLVSQRWSEHFAVGHLHFLLFEWVRPCGIDHKSVDCFPNERWRFSAATPPDYRLCRSIDSLIDQVPAKDKQLHMKQKNSINLTASDRICAKELRRRGK